MYKLIFSSCDHLLHNQWYQDYCLKIAGRTSITQTGYLKTGFCANQSTTPVEDTHVGFGHKEKDK
jgi:hypothetical protein